MKRFLAIYIGSLSARENAEHKAESHEAAARMFEDHPHVTIFPGDSVEIMECLPMPGPKR